MAQTKVFRDRVVSLEQTQEIGEKHLDLLTELVTEALPEFTRTESGLDHERDLFYLELAHASSGGKKRVLFTRMVLADAAGLPAVIEAPRSPARERIVDSIRRQGDRREIQVLYRDVMNEDERAEADTIDAEWRKKQEALLAAKRAEEERRAAERRRQKQQEEARRKAQREKQGRGAAAQAQPSAPGAPGSGRSGRRRRGRGERPNAAGGPATPPASASRPEPPRAEPRPNPDVPPPANVGEGGGRRRRRRGRGGRGGPRPGGPQAPAGGGAG